jgi:hypothetical protein
MHPWWAAGGVVLGLAGALAAAEGRRAGQTPDVRSLLRDLAHFTDADWSAVEKGVAVAKILATDSREVAVAGAVRIAAPRERLVARLRDVEHLKRSAVVLDAGRFANPPTSADVANVPIDDYNLDLRDCRPGECRVRLTAADIEAFHRSVDWRGRDWRGRALAVWRDVLVGHAKSYTTLGREGLPIYVNKAEALSVASELSLLAGHFAFVANYSPEFFAYLKEFGPAKPVGMEDTLYWTKEDFGIRPVLRVSHQVLRAVSGEPAVLAATNQVYADHYLDAALGVTIAVETPDGGAGRALYLIAVNRARTRSLSGILRRMVRGTVQNRSREAMRKILSAAKSGLEGYGGR